MKQESIKEHTEKVQVLRWHEGTTITALAMQAITLLNERCGVKGELAGFTDVLNEGCEFPIHSPETKLCQLFRCLSVFFYKPVQAFSLTHTAPHLCSSS